VSLEGAFLDSKPFIGGYVPGGGFLRGYVAVRLEGNQSLVGVVEEMIFV
jgi:hypothetical protein